MLSRLVALALLSVAPAWGQTMPAVMVFGEDDEAAHYTCNVSYSDSVATLQAGLRHNQVLVEYDREADKAISLYVNLTALPLPQGSCVVGVEVRMYEAAPFISPASGARHFVRGLYCLRGTMLRGPGIDLQARVNDELTGFLNLCIAEYQKSIVK